MRTFPYIDWGRTGAWNLKKKWSIWPCAFQGQGWQLTGSWFRCPWPLNTPFDTALVNREWASVCLQIHVLKAGWQTWKHEASVGLFTYLELPWRGTARSFSCAIIIRWPTHRWMILFILWSCRSWWLMTPSTLWASFRQHCYLQRFSLVGCQNTRLTWSLNKGEVL